MCFDEDARPPIPPIAGGAVDAERLHLTTVDGDRFVAFSARAAATPTEVAMLILPDVRGLHRYYEELAVRLASAASMPWLSTTSGGPRLTTTVERHSNRCPTCRARRTPA